jgi:hypothetical protein
VNGGSRNGKEAAGSSDGVMIRLRMAKQEHEHEDDEDEDDEDEDAEDDDDDDDEGLVQCLRCERRLQERQGSSRKQQRWREDLSQNGKAGTRRRRR